MKFILRWLISSLTLVFVAYLLTGIWFESFAAVIIAALILGIVNALIRPFILVLTLPINVLTLGLFTLFINALMLWLVYLIVPGFEIINFSTAIWAGILYWIINWFLNLIFKEDDRMENKYEN